MQQSITVDGAQDHSEQKDILKRRKGMRILFCATSNVMIVLENIWAYIESKTKIYYSFRLACNANTWEHVYNGVICGACRALINIDRYGSCRKYCKSLGLACLNAFEESGDSCTIKSKEDCDTDFYWTSDALCECSVETTGITRFRNLILKPEFFQIEGII